MPGLYDLLKVAFGIRLLFILVGYVIDSLPGQGLSYTDIDYYIFSDAAKLVLNGLSPYERSTYRYPPALAHLLIYNHILFPEFGKISKSLQPLTKTSPTT